MHNTVMHNTIHGLDLIQGSVSKITTVHEVEFVKTYTRKCSNFSVRWNGKWRRTNEDKFNYRTVQEREETTQSLKKT